MFIGGLFMSEIVLITKIKSKNIQKLMKKKTKTKKNPKGKYESETIKRTYRGND